MLHTLSVAVFSEEPGDILTKHSVKKHKVSKCYQKNTMDQVQLLPIHGHILSLLYNPWKTEGKYLGQMYSNDF